MAGTGDQGKDAVGRCTQARFPACPQAADCSCVLGASLLRVAPQNRTKERRRGPAPSFPSRALISALASFSPAQVHAHLSYRNALHPISQTHLALNAFPANHHLPSAYQLLNQQPLKFARIQEQ